MTLARGFKTAAETTAVQLRSAVGLDAVDPIDLAALARHLGVRVVSADSLVSLDRLHEIERLQAFAFSACTFDIRGKSVVVYNPLRTPGRRSSDIAHELSHLILKHELSEIEYLGDLPFRTCRADQEEQATTLGATLLLPRPLLLAAAKRGTTIDELAEQNQVTVEMARYRWNTTGVARQASAGTTRRPTTMARTGRA